MPNHGLDCGCTYADLEPVAMIESGVYTFICRKHGIVYYTRNPQSILNAGKTWLDSLAHSC